VTVLIIVYGKVCVAEMRIYPICKVGQVVKNKNKTYDIGPMQINSSWLPTLARYGITQHDLQYDACKNIEVGTWILSKMIANGKDLLSGIGNYHSHTANFNKHYGSMVKVNYAKILIASK